MDLDLSLSSAGENRSNWIGVSSKRLSIGVEGGVGGLVVLDESLEKTKYVHKIKIFFSIKFI